ncbi:DUF6691 family protein [Candidatus Methylospira mobilis]|uniref:DUF6691 family protein n=1 Tax=Candidatus Methylospira mobilis TaxID=1808979 RepID=UPI0028E7B5B6|nr:DUF6691 family protein [Candidatus Methylospira mobilis]WNV05221.1 DUF6691 family protein [Candidatus Methylospira mobilis]
MKKLLITFLTGALFAFGLALSGMAQPSVVLAFLDITGNWNPALLLVMAGAIGVTLPAYRLLFRSGKPLLAERFDLPAATRISGRLITGSALFGIGWGLSGYCPGAALVALPGALETGVFIAAMLAGFWISRLLDSVFPAAAD